MWEQAQTEDKTAVRGKEAKPQPAAGRPAQKQPARGADKATGEYILIVQILLCAAIMAFVLCAQKVGGALYGDLRVAYSTAMQAPGPQLLEEERGLLKFTQQAAAGLYDAACQVFAQLRGVAPAEESNAQGAGQDTALSAGDPRTAHTAPQPPYGSSEESYLPPFPLCFPLPDADCDNTSGYGWRVDPVKGSGQEFHTGADLSAAEGTPVIAAADGVVRMARAHDSYGNYVRLLHPNGDETLYAHMRYLYVRAGQTVEQGQVIGVSGSTGNVTGPHLHFELLHEGVRYDPSEALRAAAGG